MNNGSPARTVSPVFFSQPTKVPSSIDQPRRGTRISQGMGGDFRWGEEGLRGGSDARCGKRHSFTSARIAAITRSASGTTIASSWGA
mgnify:CR=1 FL=1